MAALETLEARGFVKQMTHEAEIREALAAGPVTFYIGFDPTADSLHAGSLVQVMTMSFLQRAGHKVVAVVGGGTSRVGDPSGKTELRKMMSDETIAANTRALKEQLSRFLTFDGESGIMVDNAIVVRIKYFIQPAENETETIQVVLSEFNTAGVH